MPSSAPAELSCPPCRFGGFELRPDDRRLLADGQPVTLGARAFDLLVALVARAGQLVSKNELLTLVWPGLVVEENNLQVQVSTLRKLLGPSALATIPGRGYRFALPVEGDGEGDRRRPADHPAGQGSPAPPATASAAAAPSRGRRAHQPPIAPVTVAVRSRADVDAVKTLLARHAVLTIAGAGGIGKTRMRADGGRAARGRARGRLSGRRLVGRAGVALRRRTGAVGGRARSGYGAWRRPAAGRHHRRRAGAAASAAGAGQLRAPVRRRRPSHRHALRRRPRTARAGHQPGDAEDLRRARLSDWRARRACRRRSRRAGNRRGRTVRGAGAGSRPALRTDGRERRRR